MDKHYHHEFHLNHREHLCSQCTRTTHCFHIECHSSALRLPITSKFLAATDYTYIPPLSEQHRRFQYFQTSMAENLNLSRSLPILPPELWQLVAGHLVRLSAAVTSQHRVPSHATALTYEIDASKPIYASYVKFDGSVYVKSLYNSSDPTSGTDIRLFSPGHRDSTITSLEIWLSEDHQGIRRIVFVAPGTLRAWYTKQRPAAGV